MSRPTQTHAAFLVGAGLLAGVLALLSTKVEWAQALGVFTATGIIASLVMLTLHLVSDRHRVRRAMGWYGVKTQQEELARSRMTGASAQIVAKASALGAALGGTLLLVIARILGVNSGIVILALGGLVAGLMITLGAIMAYHLWRVRQYYGPEHDVTDI